MHSNGLAVSGVVTKERFPDYSLLKKPLVTQGTSFALPKAL